MMKLNKFIATALLILTPTITGAQVISIPVSSNSAQKAYELRTITGIVVDATTGEPVEGAMVKARGAEGFSVLTDEHGTYQLQMPTFVSSIQIESPDHNVLVCGISREERQSPKYLYPQNFRADEKETNVMGTRRVAVGIASAPVNVKDEIQKQLGAFAYTRTRNGMPGLGSTMFVQGLNSLNINAQPLLVVDGVLLEQQQERTFLHDGFFNDILSNINPADIESVEVMRNGTALYGAKGANGVILINTRRAKSMATRITANLSAGMTFLPKMTPMMDAEQYRNYASEMLKTVNTGITDFKFLNSNPNYYYYPQYHNETNWSKGLYHEAVTQNYGINVEGGDTEARYNLSVGYTSAQSTLRQNDMDRLNVRFNSDIRLGSKLDIRFDASFSNLTRNIRDDGAPMSYTEGTPTSPSFLGYVKAPFISPYTFGRGMISKEHYEISDETYLDEALALYDNYNYKLANPYAINEYAEAENKNHFENSLLNLTITPTFNFNRHLSLSEHFSYSLVNTNEHYYIPVNGVPDYFVASVNGLRENEARSLYSKQNSVQSETRLQWDNTYDAHRISLLGGLRLNWENYSLSTQLGYNTGSDKTPFISSSLLNAQTHGATESQNSIAAFAQATYSYRERYHLQANLTTEGSSLFGRDAGAFRLFDAGWGLFPSVEAAWVVSNETWMSRLSFIDYLKLTAGYDISGNDAIQQLASRTYFASTMYLNDISGLHLAGIGNNKIKWETTRRLNFGLEARLLRNRLAFTVNFFRSTTSDLLMRQQLKNISGLDYNWNNDGKLRNTGFDLTVSGKLIATKDWMWELGFSVGHYKNKIVSLADGKPYVDNEVCGATVRTAVGQAANVFWGYKANGVLSSLHEAQEAGLYVLGENGIDRQYFQAGDIRFADLDGNHQIDENDRCAIGDPNPDFYGNIFSSVGWKRLRLDVAFSYSQGNDIFNYMRSQLEGGSRFMNQTTTLTNRWQMDGQLTDVPRIVFQDPMGNSRFSDRWIDDGSYLRLKSVTLSYRLPVKQSFIQGVELWAQGNNLLTLTKYLGADPEVNSYNTVIGQGIDTGVLPTSRNFTVGAKINF